MFIDKLALNNFRNYDEEEISFSEGINILYGDNAQGKTNVLEAIYMTATTKSHRGNRDKEIIQFGFDEAHIRADIKKNDIGHRIDIQQHYCHRRGIRFRHNNSYNRRRGLHVDSHGDRHAIHHNIQPCSLGKKRWC